MSICCYLSEENIPRISSSPFFKLTVLSVDRTEKEIGILKAFTRFI